MAFYTQPPSGMVDYSDPAMSTVDALAQVLSGTLVDHVVSHSRSQYSGVGGVSACGLAAMNCARIVLLKERDGIRGKNLLYELLKEQTTSVSSMWSTTAKSTCTDRVSIRTCSRSVHLGPVPHTWTSKKLQKHPYFVVL